MKTCKVWNSELSRSPSCWFVKSESCGARGAPVMNLWCFTFWFDAPPWRHGCRATAGLGWDKHHVMPDLTWGYTDLVYKIFMCIHTFSTPSIVKESLYNHIFINECCYVVKHVYNVATACLYVSRRLSHLLFSLQVYANLYARNSLTMIFILKAIAHVPLVFLWI